MVLSAVIGYRALPRGHDCPNCAQDTLPLVSHVLRSFKTVVPGLTMERRWCPTCSWEGYAREAEAIAPPLFAHAMPVATTRETQPLRSLELGGRSWNEDAELVVDETYQPAAIESRRAGAAPLIGRAQ